MLNSMELLSSLVIIPLAIPLLFVKDSQHYPVLLNFLYLIQNLSVGMIGGVYLNQNKEKQMSFTSP